MKQNNNGQMILNGLAETREFFEQVSLLIRTAEEDFREKGWELISSSSECSDVTRQLSRPQKWMPRWVARLFINDEHENILIYVGVLLDRVGSWAGFREPWITCGLFEYLSGKNPHVNWDLNWVTTHLESEKDPDGKFNLREYPPMERESESILKESTMALPLVEITDANALKQKIIVPLLEEISNICRTDDE